MARSKELTEKRAMANASGAKLFLLLFFPFLIQGCWITDRSEEEQKITPDIINNPSKGGEVPKIAFEEKVHNFGTISQGEEVKHSFIYQNAGEAPLVIVSIEPSCGCTVAEDPPEKPIAPGKSDTLRVTYDSDGHRGHQSRSISVVANTSPKTTVVRMKGTVKGPR